MSIVIRDPKILTAGDVVSGGGMGAYLHRVVTSGTDPRRHGWRGISVNFFDLEAMRERPQDFHEHQFIGPIRVEVEE